MLYPYPYPYRRTHTSYHPAKLTEIDGVAEVEDLSPRKTVRGNDAVGIGCRPSGLEVADAWARRRSIDALAVHDHSEQLWALQVTCCLGVRHIEDLVQSRLVTHLGF